MSKSEEKSEAELIADALMENIRSFYSEVEEELEKMGFKSYEEKQWLCQFCLNIGIKNSPVAQPKIDLLFKDLPTPQSLVSSLNLPSLISAQNFDLKEFEKQHASIIGFYNLGMASGIIDLANISLRKSEFKEFVSLTLVARESYGLYKSQIRERAYISYRAKYNGKLAHIGTPKQIAKSFIKDCWREWRKDPSRYKSKAAFARDMLDKCDELESTDKICRWCNEWEKELSN